MELSLYMEIAGIYAGEVIATGDFHAGCKHRLMKSPPIDEPDEDRIENLLILLGKHNIKHLLSQAVVDRIEDKMIKAAKDE